MSAVMSRVVAIARHEECDAITGACQRQHVVERLVGEVRDVDHNPSFVELADASLPKGVRPLCAAVGDESASCLFFKCVTASDSGRVGGYFRRCPRFVVSCAALHTHQPAILCSETRGGCRRRCRQQSGRSGCAADRLVHRGDERVRGGEPLCR